MTLSTFAAKQFIMNPQSPVSSKKLLHSIKYIDNNQLKKARRIKQIVREKQIIRKQVWNNDKLDLQKLLIDYPFHPEVGITAHFLFNTKGVKLIRGGHRVYFGQVNKNKKHGKGISVYSDGRIYQGNYQNNQKSGKGYEVYLNGNVYIGDFYGNKKHGQGTFYWLNLQQMGIIEYYTGEWWSALPSGLGKHQRFNGDLYEGEFKNGSKNGKGIQRFYNGDVYHGQYINGLPQGHGQYTWKNKSSYKEQFKQGLRCGFGCWKKDESQNSESYAGNYDLDLKSGYGIYKWIDGKVYKGHFFLDKRHGFGQLYEKQILKYKGKWQNGKPFKISKNSSRSRLNSIQSTQSFESSNIKCIRPSKPNNISLNFKVKQQRHKTLESSNINIKQITQLQRLNSTIKNTKQIEQGNLISKLSLTSHMKGVSQNNGRYSLKSRLIDKQITLPVQKIRNSVK